MDNEKLKVFGIKENKDGLPELVAKGSDEEAKIILSKAKKEGIEIIKDKSTVELLSKVDLYEGIPQEAYEVISEILLYIYEIEKEGKGT